MSAAHRAPGRRSSWRHLRLSKRVSLALLFVGSWRRYILDCGSKPGEGRGEVVLALPIEPLLMGTEACNAGADFRSHVAGCGRLWRRDRGSGLGGASIAWRISDDRACGNAARSGRHVAGSSDCAKAASVSPVSSGFPVTDRTNSNVCAINESRSSFQRMPHPKQPNRLSLCRIKRGPWLGG